MRNESEKEPVDHDVLGDETKKEAGIEEEHVTFVFRKMREEEWIAEPWLGKYRLEGT